MARLQVAVIFGGRSGEHEVSLVSADSVMNALDRERYDVLPIGIDKQGRWWTGADTLRMLRDGVGQCTPCTLLPEPGRGAVLVFEEGGMRELPVDVLFPALHGTNGEDGTMQGLFELAELPYVGAGVAGSAAAMDKILQKRLHRDAGLPIAEFRAYLSTAVRDDAEAVAADAATLGFPLFVKPPNLGSSVGIGKARDMAELVEALRNAARYDSRVLAERAIPAAREIEVAVLGNEEVRCSVPGEIVPSNEFYDYEAKYVSGASALYIPAEVDDALARRLQDMAELAFRSLHCEGMARVDFLLSRDTGELVVNEVNTIPGFTSISMYPKLFDAVGLEYPQLLDALIELALRRHERSAALLRSYTPSTNWFREDA